MIPDIDLIPTPKEPTPLVTIALGDSVARHMNARYYMLQLDALIQAAEKIGYVFTHQKRYEGLPQDVEAYLGSVVIIARGSALSPDDTSWDLCRAAARRRDDGYARVLIHELLHELGMNGLHFHVGPNGYDSKAIQDQEKEWAEACWLTPATSAEEASALADSIYEAMTSTTEHP